MDQYVYICSYVEGEGQGIYGTRLTSNGCTVPVQLADTIAPSFFCINKKNTFMYVVGEPERGAGKISVFKIREGTHELMLQQSIEAPSLGICHVSLSPDERFLLMTSYFDATIQVYPVLSDGSIGEISQFLQRTGHSVNPERQYQAHPHSVWFTPDAKYTLVCDLGTDEILFYELNEDGTLTERPELHTKVPLGYGPRHLVFHPEKNIVYIAAEITDHVLVYSYDPETGFTFMQDLMASACSDPAFTASAIRITRDGRHVYVSNRGEDTITVYRTDEEGLLTEVERISSQGHTPREMNLDLTDTYMICGGQNSDTTTVFLRNHDSGVLRPLLTFDKIRKPIAIQYIPDIEG